MRYAFALALAVCLTAVGVPQASAASDRTTQARARFKSAQDAYDRGDHAKALEVFRELVRETESPNARLYVARSLRELGRVVEAYEEMSVTVRDATERSKNEPRFAATRDAAAAERLSLEARIGRIIVAIADPPPGLVIQVNGRELAPDRIGTPVAVVPGEVTVKARAPDFVNVQQETSIGGGELRTIALTLTHPKSEAKPSTAPSAPLSRAPPPVVEPTSNGLRPLGYVALGIGALGLGTFAVVGTLANQRFDHIKDECGGTRCTDPSLREEIESGQRLDTIANMGLVVGAVGVVSGTALVLFGGPKAQEHANVGVGKNSAWVSYRGQF